MSTPTSRTRIHAAEGGFTLVEIMVVVVILGLLATLVVANVVPVGDTARETKAKADVCSLADMVRSYRVKNGKFPDSLDVLATKDGRGRSELEYLSKDPWDHDYVLRVDGGDFVVLSMGMDGSENTEDDISSKPKQDK